MLLTIKQSKEMFCPHAAQACEGPGCAMWRWAEAALQRLYTPDDVTATDEPERWDGLTSDWEWHPYDDFMGEPAHWLESLAAAKARRRGYCGLAGKPEITR